MKWTDVTSYSRSDKERKPTSWQLDAGPLAVTVVFNHRDRPGEWCFHCYDLGMDTESLPGVSTEQEAKSKALTVIGLRLSRLLDTLSLMQQAS